MVNNYHFQAAQAEQRRNQLCKEAKLIRLLRQDRPQRAVYYRHVLILLGDLLITVGTKLKTYSYVPTHLVKHVERTM